MDLEEALKKGVIEKVEVDENLVVKENTEAENDKNKARENYEKADYKWSIISAYYSMFHKVKALMFSEGYKEKGHLAVLVFLDEMIKEGRVEGKYKNYFMAAKEAREDADYRYSYSKERAEETLRYCEEFNNKIDKILS